MRFGILRLFLDEEGITPLPEIPYDEQFTAAITNGKTVVEWDTDLGERIRHCWQEIMQLVETD